MPIFAVAPVGGVNKVAIRGDMLVDGSVAAVTIKAGAITSDSGVIGALSVKNLSIGDNAATVPSAQNISTNVTNSMATVASFTLSLDTTGLAGKTVPIWALGLLIAAGMSSSATFDGLLYINGVLAQSIGGQGSPPTLALSGLVSVVANGGVMSIPVLLQSVSSGTFPITGSLFAIAAKR